MPGIFYPMPNRKARKTMYGLSVCRMNTIARKSMYGLPVCRTVKLSAIEGFPLEGVPQMFFELISRHARDRHGAISDHLLCFAFAVVRCSPVFCIHKMAEPFTYFITRHRYKFFGASPTPKTFCRVTGGSQAFTQS